jgi:hypothetical protein
VSAGLVKIPAALLGYLGRNQRTKNIFASIDELIGM